jgi:hypothetical protein
MVWREKKERWQFGNVMKWRTKVSVHFAIHSKVTKHMVYFGFGSFLLYEENYSQSGNFMRSLGWPPFVGGGGLVLIRQDADKFINFHRKHRSQEGHDFLTATLQMVKVFQCFNKLKF